MEMQDKEFDDVFNSKLGDLEMEPSAGLWNEIADELEGKKTKRTIVPWLSIAASVILLVIAGVLFLEKNPKKRGKQTKPDQLTVTHNHPAIIIKDSLVKATPVPEIIAGHNNAIATVSKRLMRKTILPLNNKAIKPAVVTEDNAIKETTQPAKTDDKELLASTPQTEQHVLQGVVPGKEIKLAPGTPDIEEQTPATTKPVMASAAKPVVTGSKKRGIHSLGGLINVLVAKVDKRQDKIIEFTDNDDDDTESSVTGVNLGIIKIKKQ